MHGYMVIAKRQNPSLSRMGSPDIWTVPLVPMTGVSGLAAMAAREIRGQCSPDRLIEWEQEPGESDTAGTCKIEKQ